MRQRFKLGDRVYHRTRREWGTYDGRTSDPTVALVTFENSTEPEKVSLHLLADNDETSH